MPFDIETTSAILRTGNVIRELHNSPLSNDRPDFLPIYIHKVERARTGTIMPCSPGVKSYSLDGVYNVSDRIINYSLDVELRDRTIAGIKDLPEQQLIHRSRDIAMAARPLQITEFEHREQRIKDNLKYLDKIRSYISDSQIIEMWDVLLDETLAAYRFDPVYISKYIKEHETSSMGAGYKWGELSGLPTPDWKQIYDHSYAWMDQLSARRYDKLYLQVPFLLGMRSRANALDHVSGHMHIENRNDRSRVVMFRSCLSMPGVFMPDKLSWYKRILHTVEEVCGSSKKIHYPMLEGGQVYQIVSDLLHDGYTHYAYDGGSWESVVGETFKGIMNPFLTTVGSLMTLPSGIYATSALGTMLSVIVASRMMSGDDEAVILGDDINIFSKRDCSRLGQGDLVAYQKEDSDVRFVLGVAYKWDSDAPRVCGFKCTTDRADKSIHLGIDEDGLIKEKNKGSADERTTELWNGLYHGQFGYQTLLESLKRTLAAEFRGGSEMIHKMAEEGYKNVTLEEAEGWMAAE